MEKVKFRKAGSVFWKGVAWGWVGGGMRRDAFQTTSTQRAAGRLRKSAWPWPGFYLSQEATCADFAFQLFRSLFQSPQLISFFFWPFSITLLLCCFHISFPLFCQDDPCVPVLLFLLYCFAASMRCKLIEIKGCAMCIPVSINGHEAYFPGHVQWMVCSVQRLWGSWAGLQQWWWWWGCWLSLFLSWSRHLHFSSHYVSSHK